MGVTTITDILGTVRRVVTISLYDGQAINVLAFNEN